MPRQGTGCCLLSAHGLRSATFPLVDRSRGRDTVLRLVQDGVFVLFCSGLRDVLGCGTIGEYMPAPATEPTYKVKLHHYGSLLPRRTHLFQVLSTRIDPVPTRKPFWREYLDSFCYSCIVDKSVSSQRR